ncbi:MAG: methylmalonyl-CoA mutase family protein [Bacillus sp. (in: firmicutes)]
MNLQKTREEVFPTVTLEDWEKKAEQSLKGKSVDSLKTNTYEGVQLQPLYVNKETGASEEFPGFAPYTRGTSALGYSEKPWYIAQPIAGNSTAAILTSLEEATNRGQNTITLTVGQLLALNEKELLQVFQEAATKEQPIFIDSKGAGKSILSQLNALSSEVAAKLEGVLAEDPISEGVAKGKGIANKEAFFATWFNQIQEAGEKAPSVKTIMVKPAVVHNAGGNAVQELATALSIAAEYLHYGTQNGLSADFIAQKIVFSFSIDSSFFMNVAKLRAARRLWSLMGQAYTEDTASFKMFIHSETSKFTQTLFDPYVNLLREGNQAFAAVIGGTQSLEVKQFDSVTNNTTAFSDRIARNIHLILKEETLIDKVVDPAGGSYYVEALTDELATKAWELFLEIEQRGGATEAFASGWIQEEVAKTLQAKQKNVATRKDSLIGTNVYPNLEDTVEMHESTVLDITLPYETNDIAALQEVRLAEEVESLRLASLRYKEQKGAYPQIGLVCIGELKSYKARMDFVNGFVATSGIATVEKQCNSVEEALAFVKEADVKHFVLCGKDEDYQEHAVAWTKAIVQASPNVTLFVAGKQKGELEQQLLEAGIKQFVAVGSNLVEFNKNVLTDLEVL